MPLKNTNRNYGGVTKTFHWLTALLIFAIIPLGLIANDLAQQIRDPAIASTPEDFSRAFVLFSLHKSLGVTIFFVALARIAWALTQPKPGLLNAEKRIEAFAAETVHWLLYGSLVLVPLAGWIDHAATAGYAPIQWPFGQSLPFVPENPALAATFAGLHVTLQRVLVIAIVLHIAGALKHHFVDRDSTLRRMLPGTSDTPIPPTNQRDLLPPLAALTFWAVAITTGFALGTIPPYSPAVTTSQAVAPPPVAPDDAPEWQVKDGTIALTITQLGNKVSGEFSDWRANITFDDTALPGPAGRVEVTIAIASLLLGNVTAQAMGPDFFDADFFPDASFSADIIRTDSGFEAAGPLVIRDTSLPVTLPFELTLEGDTAQMTGTLSLNRLDFGVGTNMPDDNTLGYDVEISVTLTATRVP